MSTFKIQAGILEDVLNLVKAKGKDHDGNDVTFINNCVLDIDKTGIIINTLDDKESLLGNVKITKFTCIEEGLIPVEMPEKKDKKNSLLVVLSRFNKDDEIEVSYDNEGIITVKRAKPRLSYKVNTIPFDDVSCHLQGEHPFTYEPKSDIWITRGGLKYITKFVLNADQFKEVIKDGEQIENRSYPLRVSTDVVINVFDTDTGAGSSRQLEIIEKKPAIVEPVASLFSYGFGNLFSNLKGEIEIWVNQDNPLIIRQINDNYEYLFILSSSESKETENLEDEGIEEIDVEDIDLDEKDLNELTEDDLYDPELEEFENADVIEKHEEKTYLDGEKELYKKNKGKDTSTWVKADLIELAKIYKINVKSKDTKEAILKAIETTSGSNL